MGGKKPSLAVVSGMGKPHDEPDGDEAEETIDEESSPEADAMDEFVKAVHGKDSGAALEAFKVLHDLVCKHEEPDGDEDGGEY